MHLDRPIRVLTREPLVLSCDAESFGAPSENFASEIAVVVQRPFTLFLQIRQLAKALDEFRPEFLPRIVAGVLRHRRDYPKNRVIIACSTREEAEGIRARGIMARFLNHNAFVNENVFRPLLQTQRRFDAICFASGSGAESCGQAALIERVCIIDDLVPDPGARRRVQLAMRRVPRGAFPNGNPIAPASKFQYPDALRISGLISQSEVGLCLADAAGLLVGAIEFQLCGLPVVCTSVSDKAVASLPDLGIIECDATAEAVVAAVSRAKAQKMPPLEARGAALKLLFRWRSRWRQFVADACAAMGHTDGAIFDGYFDEKNRGLNDVALNSLADLGRALHAARGFASASLAPASETSGSSFRDLRAKLEPSPERRDRALDRTDPMIEAWADAQTDVWTRLRPSAESTEFVFDRLNDAEADVFLYSFDGGGVNMLPKPQFSVGEVENPTDVLVLRAKFYLEFFRKTAKAASMPFRGIVAMSMHDTPIHDASIPMFAFQKRAGTTPILVPDIDAIRHKFYKDFPPDEQPFRSKRDSAIFVGSTTGDMHSVSSVAALSCQRLRSGVYFRGVDEVDYRLPQIVQCIEPAAEVAIRELGFGVGMAGWDEQLGHKFLISLDGNGATCSRVAIALRSNSALIKYNSPSQLFYFAGLQPWTHYLPVEGDEEVVPLVKAERECPGLYEEIATNGRVFSDRFLTESAAIRFTTHVLARYFLCFTGSFRTQR